MRFVFLGAGSIANRCLDLYRQKFTDEHALVGLVAPLDLLAKVREGKSPSGLDVAELELSERDRNEPALKQLIKSTFPDFIVSVQYPWILSETVIQMTGNRVINLHNAKLPDYRGHNSLSYEIINGEKVHTSTLHWIVKEVDRGNELMTKVMDIYHDDTAYSLWKRSIESCVGLFDCLLANCLRLVPAMPGKPIPDGGRYYSKKDIQALKIISADAAVEDVDRIARAFWFPPHEPAYFMVEGRKLYVMPNTFAYPQV